MKPEASMTCTAFHSNRRLAAGPIRDVARHVKEFMDGDPNALVLVFDDATSQPVEFDLRGSINDVLARLPPAEETVRGPGRPKLGVVPREVTLLPRHWEWLGTQPGGASVALRKLVEEARRANAGKDADRATQQIMYRFMIAVVGNAPGFEEASRALFAGDVDRFKTSIAAWPVDIRDHLNKLRLTPSP